MFGSIFHHELVETQIKLFASNEKGPNESTGQVQSIGIKIIVKNYILILTWYVPSKTQKTSLFLIDRFGILWRNLKYRKIHKIYLIFLLTSISLGNMANLQ